MWSLWSLLLFEGKWDRRTACPQGAESLSPAALIRQLGSLPLKTKRASRAKKKSSVGRPKAVSWTK